MLENNATGEVFSFSQREKGGNFRHHRMKSIILFVLMSVCLLSLPAQTIRKEVERGVDEALRQRDSSRTFDRLETLNEINKAKKDITDKIDDANFRVELDATGKPLHQPSEFYDYSRGDATKWPESMKRTMPDSVRAARKANAYKAAWEQYNAKRLAESEARTESAVSTPDDSRQKALEASKQMARRLYPSIDAPNSVLAQRWQQLYSAIPESDPMKYDVDTPLKLTIRAANQLRISPSE